MNASTGTTPPRLLVPACLLFALVVFGRLVFVSLYAESVPYWDQWGAEGERLLKPWIEGTLSLRDLVASHNEHRILLTRLVSLALFEVNDGQWDNLVAAYANVFIYASVPTLLFVLLGTGLRSRSARGTLLFALLALAWLPYAWENTRIGFQNQFFFMSLLAVLCIWIAASTRDGRSLFAKPGTPALLGLFTMASGILGPIAAGGVLTVRMLLRQVHPRTGIPAVLLLAAITLAGFAAIPHIKPHDVYKATGIADWLGHFLANLSWPLTRGRFAWLFLWLPTMLTLWRVLRSRQADRHELLALGLGAWAILQAAAIAYSRGVLSPRYLDTMSIGLVANLWLALRLLELAHGTHGIRRLRPAVPAALFALFCLMGFLRSTPRDLVAVEENTALSTQQIAHVRAYVQTGDQRFLDDKPRLVIPYPWPDHLAALLSDPSLRPTLPPSIRPALPLATATMDRDIRIGDGDLGQHISSCPDADACLVAQGHWRSQPLSSRMPYLQWPVRIDGSGPAGLGMAVLSEGSAPHAAPLPAAAAARPRVILPVPTDVPFSLEIADASDAAAFHVRGPVEVGRLSRLAMALQDRIRLLAGRPTSDRLQRDRLLVTAPAAEDGRRALVLQPDRLAQLEWNSPRDGTLSGVAVLIGNYGGASDGRLAVQACIGAECRSAHASLQRSIDNQQFELLLPSALRVHAGDHIVLKLWTHGATRPVAFWVHQPAQGSAMIRHFGETPHAELVDAAPPLTLIFSD